MEVNLVKISVIVPVYKVEKYLEKCLNSILNQTYKNLEIILVDDGSPDNCGVICDQYAKLDNRIIVIHKENGGLSEARNAGLNIASGDLIGFVDSDDYIEPSMFQVLYDNLVSHKADISLCGVYLVDDDEKELGHLIVENKTCTGKEILEKYDFFYGGYVVVWNKLYRKEIFEDLRFKKGRIHEDEFIFHHVFSKCSTVVSVPIPLYNYLQRPNSIMGNHSGNEQLDVMEALIERMNWYISQRYSSHSIYRIVRQIDMVAFLTHKYKLDTYEVVRKKELINNYRRAINSFLKYSKNAKHILIGMLSMVSPCMTYRIIMKER